ncbi:MULTISPECIES: hypothetical protein [unclassified Sphingomonas]|uniref:hypothetical protein n=1 Tax=unclassified Sphingomonas TaxID=196159 RepID=UPI00226A028F|nr:MULTISPECIES: hypothetical protein [unclassified Sphingomonas]
MTKPTTLCDQLIQHALDHTDHTAPAVAVLMRAAATIMHRAFGPDKAVALMVEMATTAEIDWHKARGVAGKAPN